jgi:hypothetical protein
MYFCSKAWQVTQEQLIIIGALETVNEPAFVSLAKWIASSSVLNGIRGATGPKTSSLKQNRTKGKGLRALKCQTPTQCI